jgi:cytoskeleton protein RodZ
MDSQVGAILRRARNRRKVELSEIEAATRIRLRYLKAIEDEEWDVLPGGVYTRGFIRTYANFLGLDGDRLAADYRAEVEGGIEPGGAPAQDPALPRPGPPRPAPSLRLGWLLAAAGAILAAVAVVSLLPGGGDGDRTVPAPGRASQGATPESATAARPPLPSGVSLQLTASAEVWVCLLDASDRPLLDGQILEAGAEAGPFRSGSFTVSFGNGEVAMMVDGSEAEIPPTSSPIGYSIGPAGHLSELGEAERPTCT